MTGLSGLEEEVISVKVLTSRYLTKVTDPTSENEVTGQSFKDEDEDEASYQSLSSSLR